MEQKQDNLGMRVRQCAGAELIRSVASTLLVFVVLFFAQPVLLAGEMTEKFKAFIENPPEGMEFYFTKDWPDPVNPAAYPGPSHYYCIWQKNAEIESISNDLDSLMANRYDVSQLRVNARYGNFYWNNYRESVIEKRDDGSEEFARFKSKYNLYDLASVFNMGINRANVGGVRWKGNSFAYTNRHDKVDLSVVGRLSESTNGYPKRVDYEIKMKDEKSAKPRVYKRRSVYHYESAFKGFEYIPNKISFYHISKSGEMSQLHQYEILKLGNVGVQEVVFFAPTTFLKSGLKLTSDSRLKRLSRIYYPTNNNRIVFYNNEGVLKETTDSTPAMVRLERQARLRRLYPYLSGGIALAFIILLLMKRKRGISTTQLK